MPSRLKGDVLFLIVGESGSGKTSICGRLENRLGAKQVKSYTTREPRHPFEDGHNFVWDYDRWKREHPKERIVAETHFADRDYWATISQINGSNLYVIDPIGIQSLKSTYVGEKQFRVIYIRVSAWARYRRMRRRGDSRRHALARLLHDRKAFRGVGRWADITIRNSDFETCCISAERYLLQEDGN